MKSINITSLDIHIANQIITTTTGQITNGTESGALNKYVSTQNHASSYIHHDVFN